LVGINKENNIDFQSYKLILILSTILYKNNFSNEKNNSRIFLQNYLLDFPIWKKNSFWKKIIQYEIIEELARQKKYNLINISKEKKENKIKRIQTIAKSYINTYIYHMISFNVDYNNINNIISFFSDYYFFDKNITESFYSILKHYKKEDIIKENNEIKKEINIIQPQQKEPLDNTLKAQQRQKSEKENININNNINNENDSLENLNINSVNNDLDNNEKNKKSINDNEYKEEDIKSQIALTENSFDKSENTLDLTIKEKSKLKIINED
jgi:hypothetical protein